MTSDELVLGKLMLSAGRDGSTGLKHMAIKSGTGRRVSRAIGPQDIISAGSQMLVMIDSNCTADHSLRLSEAWRDLSGSTPDQDLPREAIAISLPNDIQIGDLVLAADQDECVEFVSDNPVVTLANNQDTTTTQTLDPSFFDPVASAQSIVVNDPSIGLQEHLTTVRARAAWPLFYEGLHAIRAESVIAVLDTGIDLDHPDLASRLWQGPGGVSGRSFVTGVSSPDDDDGHGSHVAGLAAAAGGNGIQGSGVMPASARLMAVKVLNSNGEGTLAGVLNGLTYATAQGADVVNMSLAVDGINTALQQAVATAVSAGVVMVIAAGNDGATQPVPSPARFARDHAGAIAVGNIMTSTEALHASSTRGTDFVQIAAPGSVNATGGLLGPNIGGGTQRLLGTSMASPLVAGAAGLAVALLRTNQTGAASRVDSGLVVRSIKSSARVVPGLTGAIEGGRVLDVEALGRLLVRDLVATDLTGVEP